MADPGHFEAIVRQLEASPYIDGKRVADIPELAAPRLYYRRAFYRQADWGFGLAVFNLWLAFAPAYSLWPLSVVGAAAAIWMMFFAEGRARAMTRQLRRSASVQMARDLLELRD